MAALPTRRWWRLWTFLALPLVAMAGISTVVAQVPTVRLEAPKGPVSTDDKLTIPVVIHDVTDLGAFEFEVSYDPAVLRIDKVEPGPFLGSSGREVNCFPPGMRETSARLACVTLGATPAGPDGSGVLATLTFKTVAAGASSLQFERLVLTDPPAQRIAAQGEDISVTVASGNGDGFAWALWGPVIGVGALAVVAATVSAAWWARRARRSQGP